MDKRIFSSMEIIDLCESIMDIHRALNTIGMIFSEFHFDTDNGNAFQGRIQKTWFKSVIDEMILRQFSKIERMRAIYKDEQEKL